MKKSISFGIVLFGLMFGLLTINWDNKTHAELSLPHNLDQNLLVAMAILFLLTGFALRKRRV
ncbi:hypothetical protein [Paenibacillus contaminans]|uniref:Uncharacterized protein n=1 Tax=Paenibacillus contaminans TaxID=450362 RepID=A0A329MNA6_9BACL|nr:hypothetical protein [Paenibacillus contaminans]RAV20203.1 hypothetical protein DQG23_17220 [Paenibacillus contaminans]